MVLLPKPGQTNGSHCRIPIGRWPGNAQTFEQPAVSYELDIQTIYTAGNLNIGDVVRVVSIGLDDFMTVTTISKGDVTGAPQSGKVSLGEGTIDISSSIAELADRQRIAENYSRG